MMIQSALVGAKGVGEKVGTKGVGAKGPNTRIFLQLKIQKAPEHII
jgi:hypothetical protein